jgi:hypothetical protein
MDSFNIWIFVFTDIDDSSGELNCSAKKIPQVSRALNPDNVTKKNTTTKPMKYVCVFFDRN